MPAPIAVVAAACEFPDARSPQELWQLALHGRQCFRRLPPERLPVADYLREPDDADSIYPIEAALLEGYAFDRQRFLVPQSSYAATDIAHWLALDVADRALAQLPSDWRQDELLKDRTAVIVANTLTGEFSRANLLRYRWPYVERQARQAAAEHLAGAELESFVDGFEKHFKSPFPAPDEDSLAGALSNTIAGRIANHFGLRGGAHAVDGACASSLVAVITACEKLQAGAVDCVVVGAVDLSLDPFELVGFARNGALARGAMRVFDRDSNGFWPGEGCGCVVLASQAFAQQRNWPVLGWIQGVGMSTDGQGGLTRPTPGGQLLALRRAWDSAALDPAAADYFEAHGTGTPTGDPVEIEALARLVGQPGRGRRPVPVGSIKANIGHTKAAAGMAGLIKALAIIEQRVVPATSGCHHPHAILDQAEVAAALRIPRAAQEIEHAQALVVGVNSFGFGGVNCHVVLQGPKPDARRTRQARAGPGSTHHPTTVPTVLEGRLPGELITLQAATRAELLTALERVKEHAATLSRAELADLAAACRPQACAAPTWRACVVADSPQALEAGCVALSVSMHGSMHGSMHHSPSPEGGEPTRVIESRWSWSAPVARTPVLAFLFPGQGLQLALNADDWSARFPFLAASLGRIVAADAAGVADAGGVIPTATLQPLLAEACIASLHLLGQFGLWPDVVLGHSFGEISGLHAAGAIDEASFRRLAILRGRAMQDDAENSAMLAITADFDQACALAAQQGVDVACHNAARRQVLSGSTAAITRAQRDCERRGVAAARLPTDRAFHSQLMLVAGRRFAADLATLSFGRPLIPVLSTITGGLLKDELLADLLVQQFTSPVKFLQALGGLNQVESLGPVDLLIEVGSGSGPGLSTLVDESAGPRCLSVLTFSDSLQPLLAAVGAAWVCGRELDLAPLYAGRLIRPYGLHLTPRFLASPCGLKAAAALPTRLASRQRAPEAEPTSAALAHPAERSALEWLQTVICELAGLPAQHVNADSRLLADLHLNSIRARHAVALVARRLGITALPFNTADVANASLGEIARQLEALRTGQIIGQAASAAAPAGVEAWIRVQSQPWLCTQWPGPDVHAAWACRLQLDDSLAPLSMALRQAAAGLFEAETSAPATLLILPAVRSDAILARLLAVSHHLARSGSAAGLLVLQAAQLSNAFLRSASAELPEQRICVLEYETLDLNTLRRGVQAFCRHNRGYSEMRLRGNQVEVRRVAPYRPPPPPTDPWLPGPGDVVLVTGGAKGIGAATARWLGARYGCRLALIGRSPPQEPEVAATLAALAAAGLRCVYLQADLCDPRASASAITKVQSALGPVAAVVHAAGINHPTALQGLELAELQATVLAKVVSLDHVLEGLRASGAPPLRLLIVFASIIGELGLAGEAHYALANEWLVQAVQTVATASPSTRCLPICWSAWGETGMARKMDGVLDQLARADTRALASTEALQMLGQLLASGHRSEAVIVSGRYGRVADPATELPTLHKHRFLDWPRVFYPGIELVADAELSTDNDRYLLDHAPYAVPVFPLVSAIEAMVSMAQCLTDTLHGTAALPVIEDLRIGDAISCAPGQRLVLRSAALVQVDGSVRTTIRCSASDFAVDHFSALLHRRRSPATRLQIDASAPAMAAQPLLYRGLTFHGPSLQRVKEYHQINARGCLARTLAGDPPPWYGRLLPADFAAGLPVLRDAVLHALQACIPQHTVLPVAAQRIELGALDAACEYFTVARQTWGDGREFSFDIEVCSDSGECVERWTGLRLARVLADPGEAGGTGGAGSVGVRRELDPALLQAYAGRLLLDTLGDAEGRVGVGQGPAREARSRTALHRALGGEPGSALGREHRGEPGTSVELTHAAHGAPQIAGHCVSFSHGAELSLAVVHPRLAVACDIQTLAHSDAQAWRLMLGEQRWVFARDLAASLALAPDSACLVTWSAAECLVKLGRRDWPFALRQASRPEAAHTGPIVILRCPTLQVAVGLVRLTGQEVDLAVALALSTEAELPSRDAAGVQPIARPSAVAAAGSKFDADADAEPQASPS